MHIAAVKWGNKYTSDQVNALKRMCDRNFDHPFICYTDDPIGLECQWRRLPQGMRGWWNKVYLFEVGDLLYFDLDVVILRGFDVPETFTMARDAWSPGGNSSVMYIPPGMEWVYRMFPGPNWPGDQDYINEVTEPAYFRRVVSFKGTISETPFQWKGEIPPMPDADVVFFHGNPRPWEVGGWVERHYG